MATDDKRPLEFMQVVYRLHTIDTDDHEEAVTEEVTADNPLTFVSGLGALLDPLEKALTEVPEGGTFDLTIPCSEAFGPFREDRVIAVAKREFEVDGQFNAARVHAGSVVPMQDEEGRQYQAVVLDVSTEEVTLDFNHPYAGMDLRYEGRMLTRREATAAEITQMLRLLAGESPCGGNCGGCSGCH